jgi:HTH-type transcriptional repressor of NAD biosynthesis genes
MAELKEKTTGFIGGKFLPLHKGHIYAIIDASNKVDDLYVVLSSSKNRDAELCKRDGIKYIPADIRLSWLGQLVQGLDNVKIVHVEDDQWDANYNWEEGADKIKKAIGKKIDVVFSSEADYKKHFDKYYPTSKHVVIDAGRTIVPISATEMRKSLYDHWDVLPNCTKSYFTKRVAVVGTESCGKSTLVKKLAKFYNTNFVEEVGRDYCEKYTNQLTTEMFNNVAMEHYLLQETKAEESNKLLFVDSEAVITQYYLDMYFSGKKSKLIEEIVKLQNYDLVLYLEPDVKWVADGTRFAGEDHVRIANNEKLKKMYADRGISFISISGNYDERFLQARKCIDQLFEKK